MGRESKAYTSLLLLNQYRHEISLHQCEVQLLLLQIGTCHFDRDGISQTVRAVLATSAQTVVLLVELVVIVVEVADGYHALTLVLVQLDVQTPLRDTGDDTVEHLPHAFRHELYLLVLDAGTFGVGSYLLHVAGVVA